jgi:hypothetical protein
MAATKKQLAAQIERLAGATDADAGLEAEQDAALDRVLCRLAEHAAAEDVLLAEADKPETTDARLREIAEQIVDLEDAFERQAREDPIGDTGDAVTRALLRLHETGGSEGVTA